MKKENISRAAKKQLKGIVPCEWNQEPFIDIFVRAAEWRINSVWHTMDEVQDCKRPYIVQFNQGFRFVMFTKPIPVSKEQAKSVFRRWAYIEDLIPNTEE